MLARGLEDRRRNTARDDRAVKINREGDVMYDFIADLDAYFCEKYAGYDKLSVMPGYKMPLMQASETDEFGRTRAYTLPANTMRLALQEKKEEILAEFKTRIVDTTFSFSFQPQGVFSRLKAKFSKDGFYKILDKILKKYDFSDEEALSVLSVDGEIWKGIRKGKFLPTKNLIFSVALAAHASYDDVRVLLAYSGYNFDYTCVKDVILCYLFEQKVFNPAMVESALAEYKIDNLFLK